MEDALECQTDLQFMRIRASDRISYLEGLAVGAALSEMQSTDLNACRTLARVLVRTSLLEGHSGALALVEAVLEAVREARGV